MENSDGEDLVKQTLNDVLFQCENLRQVILVGHSMGGAIALFAALHFSRLNLDLPMYRQMRSFLSDAWRLSHVILIGCPNVGDDNFATLCQNRFRSIIAFTDPLDPVTKLPPSTFHGFTCPGICVPLSSGNLKRLCFKESFICHCFPKIITWKWLFHQRGVDEKKCFFRPPWWVLHFWTWDLGGGDLR